MTGHTLSLRVGVTLDLQAIVGIPGIDASAKLLAFARRHHHRHGEFSLGDVTRLRAMGSVRGDSFDSVTFLLSIQDIKPWNRLSRRLTP